MKAVGIKTYLPTDEEESLIDAGKILATVAAVLHPISAEILRQAHAQIESGRTVGKIVIEGWG